MSEQMSGGCDCCGKQNMILTRKYFHYDVKCDCCGGAAKNYHFEIVDHCSDCTPRAPSRIRITLDNMTPIE